MILQVNTSSLNSYIFLTQLLPFHFQGMQLSSSILLVELPLSIDIFYPFIVFYSHLLHPRQN